jgi:hypothetical protein
MTTNTLHYQPKGSMCAVCTNKLKDCSKLDFKSMGVLSKMGDDTIIVKCTDFDREFVPCNLKYIIKL